MKLDNDGARVARAIDEIRLTPEYEAARCPPGCEAMGMRRAAYAASESLYIRVRQCNISLSMIEHTHATIHPTNVHRGSDAQHVAFLERAYVGALIWFLSWTFVDEVSP